MYISSSCRDRHATTISWWQCYWWYHVTTTAPQNCCLLVLGIVSFYFIILHCFDFFFVKPHSRVFFVGWTINQAFGLKTTRSITKDSLCQKVFKLFHFYVTGFKLTTTSTCCRVLVEVVANVTLVFFLSCVDVHVMNFKLVNFVYFELNINILDHNN